MDNFFELERRCKRYHIKKWIPIVLFLVAVLSVVMYFIFSNKQVDTKNNVLEKNVTNIALNKKISTEVIKKDNDVINKEEKNIPKKIPTLKVEFNLNEIETKKENNSVIKESPKQKKQPIETDTIIKDVEVKPKEIKINKLIITTKLPSFEKSFELMNLYFNNHDYVKAKEWAIKANKVKPYNEDVWNVYALSLYRLNEKEKAIAVLETYLKYKESKKLENTLKIITQGKNK